MSRAFVTFVLLAAAFVEAAVVRQLVLHYLISTETDLVFCSLCTVRAST